MYTCYTLQNGSSFKCSKSRIRYISLYNYISLFEINERYSTPAGVHIQFNLDGQIAAVFPEYSVTRAGAGLQILHCPSPKAPRHLCVCRGEQSNRRKTDRPGLENCLADLPSPMEALNDRTNVL